MYGSTSGPWIWLHIHWVFWGIATFGFVAGLLWLYKHASKKDFLNLVWASLAVGILGGLLTAPVALTGWNQMMELHHGSDDRWEAMEEYWDRSDDDEAFDMNDRMEEMMDWDEDSNS